MKVALTIARLDIRRRLRDRSAVVTGFVAPFVLSGIMGLAFGSGDNTTQVRVVIADVENTPATRAYVDAVLRSLSLGPGVDVRRTNDPSLALKLYGDHKVSAEIELEPGSHDRIRRGDRPLLNVNSTRTRPLGKAVADAFVAGVKVRQVTFQIASRTLSSAGVPEPAASVAAGAAVRAPPAVTLSDAGAAVRQASPLGYLAPSMAIVFLFLSVGAAAGSILGERTQGTMVRLQAAPVGFGTVVAGKTLSIIGLMLISVLSLWGATSLVFGAHWGAPPAVLLLSTATVAAIGAIGLFIAVSARDAATAQAATAGVGFVLALLGGNFFPPGSLPPALEKAALFTPNGWALEGFTTLTLDGGSIADIVRPVAVLLTMALVVGTFAVVRLRRTLAAPAASPA
jgi:ABC-2 type transport system permease protein